MAEKEMSFWDHLEEFRWTIIRILIAVVVFSVVGFIIIPHIFDSVILAPRDSDFVTYKFFEKAGEYIPFLPDFSSDSFRVEMRSEERRVGKECRCWWCRYVVYIK